MASYAANLLRQNINTRSNTDYRLYFLTDGILLLIVTFGIWGLVNVYRWIKRRDEHFRRIHALNNDLVELIKERARANGIDPLSLPEMAAMESAVRQQAEREQPKGPALWLILSLITGIASWYVTYFLTVDYYHHEQRQKVIVDKGNAVLARANLHGRMQYNAVLPERHFWLNLVVTFVTLGIWGIVWYYRLFSDPNRHFESEWQWEDGLEQALA